MRGEPLDGVETTEVQTAYTNVCGLLASIPRLEPVRDIIAGLNGLGGPAGAQVLRLAMEFDSLEARGVSETGALAIMQTWMARYEPKFWMPPQGMRSPAGLGSTERGVGRRSGQRDPRRGGYPQTQRGSDRSAWSRALAQRDSAYRAIPRELAKATVSVSNVGGRGARRSRELVVEEIQVPELFATG